MARERSVVNVQQGPSYVSDAVYTSGALSCQIVSHQSPVRVEVVVHRQHWCTGCRAGGLEIDISVDQTLKIYILVI